jgi:hypothetical protein
MGQHSKLISIIIGLSMFAGAQGARAAATNQKSIGTMVPAVLLLPAELDPMFQLKLVQRIRGPYERSHLSLWALAD